MDTIYAVEYIAKKLGISSDKMEFAGIKDNRAITAQEVTVEGDYWNELASIATSLPNFEVKSIDYTSAPLKTGQLWGNNFIITIRDIQRDKKDCKQGITSTLQQFDYNTLLRYCQASLQLYYHYAFYYPICNTPEMLVVTLGVARQDTPLITYKRAPVRFFRHPI